MSDFRRLKALGRIGALSKDLRAIHTLPGMTLRTMAALSGVNKSAVSRAMLHGTVSAESYLMLHNWVEENAALLAALPERVNDAKP